MAGENACPPEDVGGVPGYADFLAILADPKHEEHTNMRNWIGYLFDPTAFDLVAVNTNPRYHQALTVKSASACFQLPTSLFVD